MTDFGNAYTTIIFITGRKMQGKSVYCRYLFRKAKRRIIYDRNFEHSTTGFVVRTVPQLRKAFLYDELTNCVFQPIHFTDEEFEELCSFIIKKISNVLFVVEEIEMQAHARGWSSQSFREIVNRGRQQGIGLIGTARRPANIHGDIKGNADYVVVFELYLPRDVKFISEWINVPEQEIKDLEPYVHLIYDAKTHKVVEEGACSYR
jgi:hypothetical protein